MFLSRITTYNFPAGDSFDVLMNVIGTQGIYGIPVATVSSGNGGSLNLYLQHPARLIWAAANCDPPAEQHRLWLFCLQLVL